MTLWLKSMMWLTMVASVCCVLKVRRQAADNLNGSAIISRLVFCAGCVTYSTLILTGHWSEHNGPWAPVVVSAPTVIAAAGIGTSTIRRLLRERGYDLHQSRPRSLLSWLLGPADLEVLEQSLSGFREELNEAREEGALLRGSAASALLRFKVLRLRVLWSAACVLNVGRSVVLSLVERIKKTT